MQALIEQELHKLGGRTACVVLRLDLSAETETEAGYEQLVSVHPERRFAAASLAKVPILVEVAHQVHQKRLAWETCYSVAEEDRVGGSGVLAELSPQFRPTLHDLAHLMITISDNTASNTLLSLVGIEAVNETMRQLGLTTTRLERRFMDFVARQAGRDNWTSAGDLARLFAAIATRLPEREQMLAILRRQNDFALLPGYWGEDFPFAHKTGWLNGILHDAGILYSPTSPNAAPLVIVTLTDEQVDEPLTRYVISQIGRKVWETVSGNEI
jgi:beta-lactamase class A